MKPVSILRRQVVKNRKQGKLSAIWKTISLIATYFLRFSCLVIGLVMISLLFVSLYEYLLTSPYIRLERIIVTGVSEEIKSDLIKMSRLKSYISLLAINLDELRQRMEKHPRIRSVTLEKRFPNTLIIRAERERPWAIVSAGKLYYLNRDGKIFKEVDETEGLDYPVVTGISMSGADREKHLEWATHVLAILEYENEPWSLSDLSEVHIKKDGNVSLYFSSLPAVIKIRGRDLGAKIGDLKKIVEHINGTGSMHMVRVINLNYKDGAVVSFKKS